ncbi:MAG: tetratricopeptide repeat protein [Myxococcales bacterium]|nr:tetratricopeptide repeat protein [Myxococcales bacterium]
MVPGDDEPGDGADSTVDMPVPPRRRRAGSEPLAPGTTIGRYVVEGPLGYGGMSTVYRAFDPELGRRVAVKLLRVGGRGAEGIALRRARLMREAHALAQLAHPNVVAVHDAGVHGEQVFVAMELIEGETLRAWLDARARSRAAILAAFGDVGRGLAAAHAAGIVHRDVKPDNAVVGRDGRVRVLDFGLARFGDSLGERSPDPDREVTLDEAELRGPSSAPLTQAGLVVGTPSYMSPEQHLGVTTGPAGDQWSFCASLWEALYGEPPFGRGGLDEIRRRVVAEPPPPPRAARVPRRLEQVLRRGLAIAAADRWPSMPALVAQLERLQRPRRWPLVVAGAAVVVAVVGWQWARARHPDAPACAEPAALLTGAWDPTISATIERAFIATDAAYAATTFARVRDQLDDVALAWRRGHHDACTATRVRREQSTATMELRMACLASRRRELAALTEVLAHADRDVLEHAVAASAGLTSPDTCADVEGLRRDARSPPAGAQAEVDAIGGGLDRALALRAAGRYDEARAVAAAALARARHLAWPPLTADALWRLGQIDVDLGRLDDAAAHLDEANLVAEAAGRDDVVFETLLAQLGLMTDERGAGDVGARLARRAEAVLIKIGDAPARHARLARSRSVLAMTVGDTATALREAEDAIAAATRAFPAHHPDLLGLRRWHASVLDRAGRPAEAIVELRQVVAELRLALGDDHPELARALLSLSILAGDLLDYDEAERTAREALRIRVVALGDDHPEVGLTLTTLGVARMWRGDRAQARADFERARAIFERAPGTHHLASSPLANLGALALEERAWAEAERHYRAALAIDEPALGPDHPDLGLDLNGLAAALVEQRGRATEALPVVARALALLRGEPRALAEGQFTLARCLVLVGRDRARARTLALAARAFFARAPAAHADELATIDAWLARAPGR